eukprot:SAG31_NODE_236_length_19594_cov_7.018620_1_plen_96_part_00
MTLCSLHLATRQLVLDLASTRDLLQRRREERQRSPNFNDLASQYLKDRNPQVLTDWEDQCLDHLDSLLSEIDYVVDQFGMQTSIRDLSDDRSTAI